MGSPSERTVKVQLVVNGQRVQIDLTGTAKDVATWVAHLLLATGAALANHRRITAPERWLAVVLANALAKPERAANQRARWKRQVLTDPNLVQERIACLVDGLVAGNDGLLGPVPAWSLDPEVKATAHLLLGGDGTDCAKPACPVAEARAAQAFTSVPRLVWGDDPGFAEVVIAALVELHRAAARAGLAPEVAPASPKWLRRALKAEPAFF